MNKLARALVIAIPTMIAGVVFLQVSSVLKILTEYHIYGVFLGAWYVAVLGLFIWLVVLLSLPRLSVTFGGGIGRPGREEVGDHPLHQGGMILGLIATICNTGGKKLTLETNMVLRDRKTGQKLCVVPLMPHVPIPEERIEQSITGKFVGTQPYCPELLELDTGETKKYRFYFFVGKYIVEKIGIDKIGKNIPVPKVSTARKDLMFIDRGLGTAFECADKEQGNEYECKRSRLP